VLNETLYSDALYAKGDVLEFGDDESSASVHVELPTVLKGRALDVDIARRGPEIEVRVNGFVRVVGLDLLASDGVLHVLDDLLIPPKKVGGKVKRNDEVTEIKVEVLKERLGGCVAGKLARIEL
jgi:Secreted and surface protein containing fasciclin-like repeats